ncbi:MAG: hypothetical protein OEM07_04445 [Gammaproteobacteria bacterium]|nr:hypothetical protein [Gammaproteobacteria bacterium]
MKASSLFVDVGASKIKWLFLLAVHVLALLSIFFIGDFGLAGTVLKIILFLFVVFSLRRYMKSCNHQVSFSLLEENQADLIIEEQVYNDLYLSSDCYVSDRVLLLIFLDASKRVVHNLLIFPDAINAAMYSQLRLKLKLMARHC